MSWLRRESLRGKTVLITGGSRGLGLLLAREFGRQGANIAICARSLNELNRAQAEFVVEGVPVFAMPCDVTCPGEIPRLVDAVTRHFGAIDVLVNNAGVIEVGPLENQTFEDFQEAMETHYWGPLHLILAVLPQMRQRQSGRIVNISSIGGKISVPHLVPYSASKFALAGLSEGLRAELRKEGIFVTTVFPGMMRTGSPRHAIFKGQHRAEYAWFSLGASLPLLSMSADRAARKIVAACRSGRAELVLGLPAKLAVKFHALFPGLTAGLLRLANHWLPAPGGIGTARTKGSESTSWISPSWLTTLNERAAARNNELEMVMSHKKSNR